MRKDRFTDEALRNAYALGALKYSENPGDQQVFAEAYDYATCERPDGSKYGTGGTCRKGKEVAPQEKGKAKGPSAKPLTRNAAGLTREEYEKQMAAMQAKTKPKKTAPKGAGGALDALATRANRAKATGTYVNKSTLEKMIKLADETGRKIKYERMPNGNFNVYVQKGS